MSGLEILGVVCGVIAAVKALPEIPKVWRSVFGRKKNKTPLLSPGSADLQSEGENQMAVARRRETRVRVNDRGNREYESTMTTFQRYDDNRTAIHHSNNRMLQKFDDNRTDIHHSNNRMLEIFDERRHLSQTQFIHLFRDILEGERAMFFKQIRLDQQMIITLLIIVAALTYLLGRYSAENEYLHHLHLPFTIGYQNVNPVTPADGSCPAQSSLLRSTPAAPGLLPGFFGACLQALNLPLLLFRSGCNLVSSAITWAIQTTGFNLLLSAFTRFVQTFQLLVWSAFSSLSSVFTWTVQSIAFLFASGDKLISSASDWISEKSVLLVGLILGLPYRYMGKMILLFLGSIMGAFTSGFAIWCSWLICSRGFPNEKMPLVLFLTFLTGAPSGGLVMHYWGFSATVCTAVALGPAFFWNGLALATGVKLRI